MLTVVIYACSCVALAFAVWVVVSAYRVRRKTIDRKQQLQWIREQSGRALEMVNSDNEMHVITGLQTLTALKEPQSQLAALTRVVELTKSQNPAIAEHAEATFREIVPTVSGDRLKQ